MSIKVAGLTKIFDTQRAVDNISFEIEPGHVVGFLGPNGAGKSTTMKILSCFIPPTSGQAFVCGYNVEKDPMSVRKNLGYLPEKNPLYYDMYVREFLEFTAGVFGLGKETKSRVDEMISITGLNREVKKKIGTLSKGYKQRVGLAQALIHKPKALILDEPTSGLDPNQIVAIRELIKQIGSDTTVLLSTHIMQEVQSMCSRVIIINEGKIVADDKIENIGLEKNERESVEGLVVEWKQELSKEKIAEIKNCLSANLLSSSNKWLFKTEQLVLLRKELLGWSLANDLDIISLQKNQATLEDTFRDLTSEKNKRQR